MFNFLSENELVQRSEQIGGLYGNSILLGKFIAQKKVWI